MRFDKIITPGLARLPAFSHASVVGDLVFVSGTLGTADDSLELVAGGIGPQTRQTLVNMGRILESAGSSLASMAKCSVYLTDMSLFAEMNEAYLEFFDDVPPARITVGVSELALGALVEMECVGVLDDG